MREPDRFFYNQVFFLQKPTTYMLEKKIEGVISLKSFDKNRFVGVAGREAFHVFDLEKMDFVCADKQSGYLTCLE